MNRYQSLLDSIKEDNIEETLSLNSRVLIIDMMNLFLRSFSIIDKVNTQGHHIGGLTGNTL